MNLASTLVPASESPFRQSLMQAKQLSNDVSARVRSDVLAFMEHSM